MREVAGAIFFGGVGFVATAFFLVHGSHAVVNDGTVILCFIGAAGGVWVSTFLNFGDSK